MKKMLTVALASGAGIVALGQITGVCPLPDNHRAFTFTAYAVYTIGVLLAGIALAWASIDKPANNEPTQEEIDALIKKIEDREAGSDAIHL